MGKILVVVLGTALLAHAEIKDAADWRARAHAAYIAGRPAEAEAAYRSALAAFGDERSLPRAVTLENVAVAKLAQGRLEEARPLLEDALAEIIELAGADSNDALQAMQNLAPVYGNLAAASIAAGEVERAESLARRGVELGRLALPAIDARQAALLNNLAQACRFMGRYQEAEANYRTALWTWELAAGDSHPDLARGYMNLAAFYHERGREAGAEQLYLRAVAILEKADPALATVARNELADVFRAQLRYTEAKKLALASLAQMDRILPAEDPRLVRAHANWTRLMAETRPRHVAANTRR